MRLICEIALKPFKSFGGLKQKIMRNIKIVLGVSTALVIMSFQGKQPLENVKTGTYGVCNCDNSGEGSVQVELTINEDKTFRYVDNSNPAKKVDIQGNWTLQDNTILLKNYQPGLPVSNKWKIDEKCIKSRNGLVFTRLCHIKSCI
ncbi:MAG: hypothetical protein FD123_2362 [Bacteroidetes bacterium]|nr:MAG: hypothetical protein FD123_2362 [Bacteroidota bacterium]